MRIHTILSAAAITAALTGCYTYPVYQPAPVARLTPAQVAAITNGQPLSQADRDQIARDNAAVNQQNQAAAAYSYASPVAPVYAAPAPYYDPYYYGYPYYYGGGFYPGVSLSLGFRGYYGRGFGGYHGGYGGGFHGHR